MFKLTHEGFEKARDYILTNSDDIDRAWFRYNFVDHDASAFMDALGKYQHENGGFGGLVYEFEYQGPCLVCTEMAFRYIFYMKDKPPSTHPVIQKAIQYLLSRYRPDVGCWGEEFEPGVNDGLHAAWMGYSTGSYPPVADIDERIRVYRPNRQAAFAAFIALYSELVPEDIYNDIIFCPVVKILRYYDKASPLYKKSGKNEYFDNDIAVPYNLKCYQQFVKCLKDKPLAEKLAGILCQDPSATMVLDVQKWETCYEELPCEIVVTPDSVVYPAVKDLVDDSLGYVIRQQCDDGAWHTGYRFGEDEGFRPLEALYDAHNTMLTLATIGRFGRIEM